MEKSIKFSIIIPVYNVEPFLNECVSSVTAQSYDNYEIILVDDGSTDASGVLCDEWSVRSEKITAIHQKNAGLSEARNAGVQLATGDYVLFLDSDDYWCDTAMLERIAGRLRLTGAEALSFNYVKVCGSVASRPYFDETLCMSIEVCAEESFEFVSKNDLWIACAWNKVISRELFLEEDLRFRSGITSEDVDWCMRLAIAASRFDFMGNVFLCYRQRAGSITKTATAKSVKTSIDNLNECLRLLENCSGEVSEQLKPYVAYQYGTLLYGVAGLKKSTEKRGIIQTVKKWAYLLSWSNHPKIKLLRMARAVVGISGTLALLRILQRIKNAKC